MTRPTQVRKAIQDEVTEFHRYGVIDIVPCKQFEEHKQLEAAAGEEHEAQRHQVVRHEQKQWNRAGDAQQVTISAKMIPDLTWCRFNFFELI